MELIENNMQIADLIDDFAQNLSFAKTHLSNSVNSPIMNLSQIDPYSKNSRAWLPGSNSNFIIYEVYFFLNGANSLEYKWQGQKNLWSLNTAPKEKIFMRLVLHGKVKTIDFLFSLNKTPNSYSVLCGINTENINYLFNHCSKVQLIWRKIEEITNIHINLCSNIISRAWPQETKTTKAKKVPSLIVAIISNIWIAQCNLIFKGIQMGPHWIIISSIDNVNDYSKDTNLQGEYFCNSFNSSSSDCYLLIDISCTSNSCLGGSGLVVVNAHRKIISAGSIRINSASPLDAELHAAGIGLKVAIEE